MKVTLFVGCLIFSEYYREETARLVQQLGDSRVQVATLEAQIEFLTNKVEEQDTVDSLYIQRSESQRISKSNMDGNWS